MIKNKSMVVFTLPIALGLSGALHAELPSNGYSLSDSQIACDKSANFCMLTAVKTLTLEDDATLVFSTSTDGGLSWSKPQNINSEVSNKNTLTTKLICNQDDLSLCQLYVSEINPENLKTTYRIFSSFDAGKTWSKMNLNSAQPNLETLTCSATGENCIASTTSGKITFSEGYGKVWVEALSNSDIPSDKQYDFHCDQQLKQCNITPHRVATANDLYMLHANINAYAVTATKTALPVPMPTNDTFGTVYQTPSIKCNDKTGNCLLVGTQLWSGDSGTNFALIMTSKDSGKTWHETRRLNALKQGNKGFPVDLTGLSCDEELKHCVLTASYVNGFVGASGINEAYITNDGGETWSEPNKLPSATTPEVDIRGLQCSADAKHCVAVGEHDGPDENPAPLMVYTSEDGGIHWSDPVSLSTDQ